VCSLDGFRTTSDPADAEISSQRIPEGGILMTRIALMPLVCLSLLGCVHQTGGVAPSNIPLEPGSYTELGPTRGNDCRYVLLGLIPITGGNETYSAVQKAIRRRKGQALVNITADTYSENFIVFSRTCTQVVATAVRLNSR
jgi:hypothetical protein